METSHGDEIEKYTSVQEKKVDTSVSFIWDNILFGERFKYGDAVNL
jgi:hypothetical protein